MQRPRPVDPAFLLFWLLVAQKWPWGFWSFCSLSIICPNCTRERACCYFQSLTVCVLFLEETCVHVQALQRRSQVPACPRSKLREPGLPAMPDSYSVSVAGRRRERGGQGALFRAVPHSAPPRTPVLQTLGPARFPGTAKAPRGDKRPFLRSRTPSPDRRSLRAELWSRSHLLL